MTTYTSSKGKEHVIAEMPYPYLCNACNKEEGHDVNSPVARALRAEIARRDEAFRAAELASQVNQ